MGFGATVPVRFWLGTNFETQFAGLQACGASKEAIGRLSVRSRGQERSVN